MIERTPSNEMGFLLFHSTSLIMKAADRGAADAIPRLTEGFSHLKEAAA